MRKFALLAAVTVAGALGATSVAHAANQYTSTSRILPANSGTFAVPTPVSAGLTAAITEPSGERPQAIKTYSIGLGAGVVPNTRRFPGCSFNQANTNPLPAQCIRAKVGSGQVQALAGAPNNRQQKIPCYLDVTLINSTVANHIYIRIDSRDAAGTPGDRQCGNVGGQTGAIQQHGAIDAVYAATTTAFARGVTPRRLLRGYSIRFTVPDFLLKPLGSLETAVVNIVANIQRKSVATTVRRNGRNVIVRRGYLESVGCPTVPRGFRLNTVIFTDLSGTTKQSTSRSACQV
ncbi:MAG TPA: hypothetical protein VNB64_02710 [Solirubrobacteraceae bacterium]|nr:hypothetical protein [Solirubrobacteraceae bacterium]